MNHLNGDTLLLGTRSEGKAREFRGLLERRGIRVETLVDVGLPELPEEGAVEAHETFEANALAKAGYFARRLPGRLVLADDSGLVVDALGGEPGVQSRRWSGRPDLAGAQLDEANNQQLLRRLEEAGAMDDASRSARFVCAIACVRSGETALLARGECEGRILRVAQGDGGFGYDPFFWSTELGRAFGEVDAGEKARVSHRARALEALLAQLQIGQNG